MKGPIRLGLIAGLMLCAVSFTAAAQVASSYRLTLISKRILDENHENHEFEVTDINDKGQVSGWRITNGAAASGGFIWRNGQFRIVLPPSGGFAARAVGINDWSELAGIYGTFPPDRTHGFFWRGGRLTEIAVVPGETELSAVHLNNRRQVVVLSRHPETGAQYFIWQRGNVTPLARVPEGFEALRINDRGIVVGQAGGAGGTSVPLLWQDGAAMLLDLPEGATTASGRDINDHNTVVVNAVVAGRSAAYLWHEGEYTALPGLPGRESTSASAINNSGVVVGSSTDDSAAGPTATVWYGVQAAELNTLVRENDPLKAHVRLRSALVLNDRGEIVARGIDLRDFDQFGAPADNHYLLTPID